MFSCNRAGPPPSTPEEALRLLAAAGWEGSVGGAIQLALREKSEQIESEKHRQDLADRWACVPVSVLTFPVVHRRAVSREMHCSTRPECLVAVRCMM